MSIRIYRSILYGYTFLSRGHKQTKSQTRSCCRSLVNIFTRSHIWQRVSKSDQQSATVLSLILWHPVNNYEHHLPQINHQWLPELDVYPTRWAISSCLAEKRSKLFQSRFASIHQHLLQVLMHTQHCMILQRLRGLGQGAQRHKWSCLEKNAFSLNDCKHVIHFLVITSMRHWSNGRFTNCFNGPSKDCETWFNRCLTIR